METVVAKESEVRIMYRKLLKEIEDTQEELANIENYRLIGFMQDSQDLFKKVTGPQEAVLDAKVMKLLAKLVRLQAEQMSTNITLFNYTEYSERLLATMQVDRDQQVTRQKMVRLGQRLKRCFRRSPPLTFLYGAVDFKPSQKPQVKEKVTRSRQAGKVGDLVETISSVVSVVERSENQTEHLVTHVLKCLVIKYMHAGRLPIDYFRFVMDPDSFGVTIENIFHVSFLVKEGKAAISVSKETGLPVIMPVSNKNMDGQGEDKNQVVINICMKDWVRIVDSLGIKESMITKV